MLGFGGSQTYNGDQLLAEEGRDAVYKALFEDLKLDYFRIRNYYDYEGQKENYEKQLKDFVGGALKYGSVPTRNKPAIKLIFTSWSPPAYLKSNKRVNGTEDGTAEGKKNVTLAKDASGKFVYDGFANWWLASLKDFNRLTGRYPDLITLQNELDIAVSYEGCEFLGTEGKTADGHEFAGYDQALAAVHAKLQKELGKDAPGITGPETFTIRLDSGDSQVKRYLDPDTEWGKNSYNLLEAVSFHIYGNGAEQQNPEEYRKALTRLKEVYRPNNSGKLLMQTEFLEGVDLVQQASMMADAFVYGDISAYFVWMSARVNPNPGNALVYYNPSDKSVERRGRFYAVKHFSNFIGQGWRRIEASLTNDQLRIAAFRKDFGPEVTIVLINPTNSPQTVTLPNQEFKKSEQFRSSETEAGEKFRSLGPLVNNEVALLPRSVVTVHYSN